MGFFGVVLCVVSLFFFLWFCLVGGFLVNKCNLWNMCENSVFCCEYFLVYTWKDQKTAFFFGLE